MSKVKEIDYYQYSNNTYEVLKEIKHLYGLQLKG